MKRRFLLLTFVALAPLFTPSVRADDKPATSVQGLRILTAAHSFHVWMPPILKEMAEAANIRGHETVDVEMIGGSQVIQHWNLPEGKNKIKPALIAGKADVLTLSPIYLPDDGIENFVKLGLEHNPKLRVTVQEFWLPYDDQALWATRAKGVTVDREKKTIEELRQAHAPYFQSMDEHVRKLNEQFGKPVIAVAPVGQAVLALRERIIRGEAPGIAKQSDLFADPVGHPRGEIQALSAYCHFAVIYKRSPIGLPAPRVIQKHLEAEKLNKMLQEMAWDAVTHHPLSGVTAAGGTAG